MGYTDLSVDMASVATIAVVIGIQNILNKQELQEHLTLEKQWTNVSIVNKYIIHSPCAETTLITTNVPFMSLLTNEWPIFMCCMLSKYAQSPESPFLFCWCRDSSIHTSHLNNPFRFNILLMIHGWAFFLSFLVVYHFFHFRLSFEISLSAVRLMRHFVP